MNLLRPASCVLRQRYRARLRAAGRGLREFGIVLALTLAPAVVLAHAYLLRSSPKAGEKVATAPKQLVLIFSTRIELAVSSVSLWTMDSVAIPLSPPRVHATERAGVVVDLPALAPGEYRVRWRTTSADGHPIQGSFRFTVLPPQGTDSVAARVEEEAHEGAVDSAAADPEQLEDSDALREGLGGIDIFRTIIRWLSFLAFFAAVGAAAFGLLILPRLEASAQVQPGAIANITRASRMVGAIAAIAVAVLAAPRLYSASAALMVAGSPTIMKYATSTTTGRALLVQIVAAAIAVLGFMIASDKRRVGPSIAAAGMLGVLFATSYEGHAAAADSALVGLLTIAHIVASSVWFGMLLVVVAVAIPRLVRSSPERPVAAVATLIGAFSPIALVCGIVAAVAGVVLGVLHVGSVAALLRSDYGRTLLVKLALVSLVFGTGLYNWRRMKPALTDPSGSDRLVRSATAELVLGALVLAATAVLVALPSPASLAP